MTPSRLPRNRLPIFATIALGGAAFDLTSKWLVFRWVGEPGPQSVVPLVSNVLEFKTSHNPGALWGMGRALPYSSTVFAALSIVAILGIIYWLFVKGAAADLGLTMALGLITAGALGNCYDRLRFGHVRDFVRFHVDAINFDFAIFNFADNMLVLGSIWLLLMALRPEPIESPRDVDHPLGVAGRNEPHAAPAETNQAVG